MFHKNVLPSWLPSLTSASPQQLPTSAPNPNPNFSPSYSPSHPHRLVLLPPGGGALPAKASSTLFDLVAVAAPRCSSFFAEAAVLVLVLALLDRLMMKGRMEVDWVVSAIAISIALLAASIATDLSCRRWLQRHKTN